MGIYQELKTNYLITHKNNCMKHCTLKCLLISATLMFIFQSCKKESAPDDTVTVAFSRNALDFVNLAQWKYLIYKDSATATEDSVIITTSKLETVYYPAYTSTWWFPASYKEKYSLVLTKYTSTSHAQWLSGFALAGGWGTAVNGPTYIDTAAVGLEETDNVYISDNSYIAIIYHTQQVMNAVIIEGKTYNNVVLTITQNTNDINNPEYKKNICYWAKGIGIIKLTVIKTGGAVKTYTLLRNN